MLIYIWFLKLFSLVLASNYMRNYAGITDIRNEVIPEGTTQIYFNGNSMTNLPSNYFPSNLERIYTYNNLISNIEDFAYAKNASGVQMMGIGGNLLAAITVNMFKGLHNLWYLNLDSNIILSIQDESFSDLNSLTTLNLKNNLLALVQEAIFDPVGHPVNLHTVFTSHQSRIY